MDDEDLLTSEALWDKSHQKMRTLEQIYKILKENQNDSGVYDIDAIDRELMSYSIIATQKELYYVAQIFATYKAKLFNL